MSDINVPSSLTLMYPNQNENQTIANINKNSNKNNSKNLSIINNYIIQDNNLNKSFNESARSDNDIQNEEDENGLLKKSSTSIIEYDNSAGLKNENEDSIKKSKTCKEENNNRLNLNRVTDNGLNRLATVLETIKEVSNSRAGSSELYSINNINKNINNSIKAIKKEENKND